jgi:hypothetical protein
MSKEAQEKTNVSGYRLMKSNLLSRPHIDTKTTSGLFSERCNLQIRDRSENINVTQTETNSALTIDDARCRLQHN